MTPNQRRSKKDHVALDEDLLMAWSRYWTRPGMAYR